MVKPMHAGIIYRLTDNMEFDRGEVLVWGIAMIPTILFEIVAILSHAWFPVIIVGISLIFQIADWIRDINDMI